jgi:hypothetical protein
MEKELRINIYQIVKTQTPEGRSSDDGETGADNVREIILSNWEKYEKIIIYFEGIVKMSRVFVDEAFAKILEKRSLDEINQKIYFPDAKEFIVKDLNTALKLRKRILSSQREREEI